jgi:hypothetical protein
MKSPFNTPAAPANPITERQLDFLCGLKSDLLKIEGYDGDLLPIMDAFELQSRSLGRREASEEIDKLKAAIAHARTQKFAPTPSTVGPFSAPQEDIDGFWELPDGRIAKVQIAVHGSGQPYAKLLNTDTGSFDYSSGLVSEVRRTGTRLPIERAKELGKLYGRCICCGRTLTDEYSIENGIGPICAQKF